MSDELIENRRKTGPRNYVLPIFIHSKQDEDQSSTVYVSGEAPCGDSHLFVDPVALRMLTKEPEPTSDNTLYYQA